MTDLALMDCQVDAPPDYQPLPLEQQPAELRGQQLRRALGIVTLAWIFGSVWATTVAAAPLTLFASALGASKFQFGLLSAMPFVASLLSMPASLLIERTGERKKIFLFGQYPNRLLWFAIALVPFYIMHKFGPAGQKTALMVFLVLMFIMHAGGAVGGPAWVSWMSDVVPERSRGKYFSRRRQWGIATAIPAALFAGWILDRLHLPNASTPARSSNSLVVMYWCAMLFMCSAIFGFLDIHLHRSVPDPEQPPPRKLALLHIFAEPMRDPHFLWFAGFVATLTFAVSFMGQFVTLYMIEKLQITNTQVQLMLLVAPMVAQLLVLPIWGRAADRMGRKPVLAIASLGLVPVGFGWCLCSREMLWLGYLLSGLGAALWAGVEVANLNLVLAMASGDTDDDPACNAAESPLASSRPAKKGGSNYVAVNSVIINVAGCLGGICAGVIAQSLRNFRWNPGVLGLHEMGAYEVLFALSGVLRLVAAVVFLPMIHEPAARPTREALRFMTANIYNNLFNAILLPLRSVTAGRRESYIPGEPETD